MNLVQNYVILTLNKGKCCVKKKLTSFLMIFNKFSSQLNSFDNWYITTVLTKDKGTVSIVTFMFIHSIVTKFPMTNTNITESAFNLKLINKCNILAFTDLI